MTSCRRRWSAALLLLAALAVGARAAASPEQEQALLLLRGAVDREGVLEEAWDPATDACTWEGVGCDASGKVVSVNLQGKGLTGQLPLDTTVWGNLNTVKNLNLANNNVDGYLPPQLSAATGLEFISLRDNAMASPLPTTWAGLQNLQGLDLGNNQITGDLPADWAKLTNLQSLDLSVNNLDGKIPASWAALPNLNELSVAANAGMCSAGASKDVAVFYGPCEAASPVLPGINPAYPPSGAPPMTPPSMMSPPPAPSPAGAPPPPVTAVPPPPKATPPPPGAQPPPPVATSPPPPVPATPPPPPVKPTTFTTMAFAVTGVTEAEFKKSEVKYKAAMGTAAGVTPAWVSTAVTEVAPSPAAAPAPSRRLLQAAAAPLQLANTIYTSDAAATQASLEKAVADGSLPDALAALGMTMDTGSIVYAGSTPAPPPPAPEDGGSSNTGAIVGGVIGGVAGVIIIGAVAAFAMKKKRSGGDNTALPVAAAGTKSGEAMYTANPAFDSGTAELVVPAPTPAPVPPPRTTADNPMFNVEDPLDTPKGTGRSAGVVAGQNELFESKQSQLSEPDKGEGRYTPSEMSQPQSARSRLDSARSGLRSNPTFKPTEILESSDDDFEDPSANPLFQSARSGTDIMASATSDLNLDTSRTYETAPSSSRINSARGAAPFSNALFGGEEDAEGENPLYQQKK